MSPPSGMDSKEDEHGANLRDDNFEALSKVLDCLAFWSPYPLFDFGETEPEPFTLVHVIANDGLVMISPTEKRSPAGRGLPGKTNMPRVEDMTFTNLCNGDKHQHHVRLTERKHHTFPHDPGQLLEAVKRDMKKIVSHLGEYQFPTTMFRFGIVSGVHTGKMQRLSQTGVEDQASADFDELWKKSRMGDLSLSFLESSGVVGIEMHCFILEKVDFFWRLSGPVLFHGDWNDK